MESESENKSYGSSEVCICSLDSSPWVINSAQST